MFIIFRYLTRQVLISMIAVSGILMLIFMSGRFIKYLAQAAAGGISADVLFTLMAYRMPGFLELILPLGLFIGILLAYGRMYLESEMTVLYACGMSQRRLVALTLGSSLIVAFIVGWMSIYLSPLGMQRVEQILIDQSKLTEFEMLAPGRFQSLRSGGRVTYTESLSDDKKQLNNVFISEQKSEEDAPVLMTARQGRQYIDDETGSRFLILHDGKRYEGTPGEADYRVIAFDTYGLKIETPDATRKKQKLEAVSTADLMASDDPKYRALMHWRFALPMLVPVVTLLAIALSRVNPRQGRFFHLLPAMLLYIAYLGVLIVARKQIEKGKIPEWLGMWWVHGLFLGLALTLMFRENLKLAWRARRAQA